MIIIKKGTASPNQKVWEDPQNPWFLDPYFPRSAPTGGAFIHNSMDKNPSQGTPPNKALWFGGYSLVTKPNQIDLSRPFLAEPNEPMRSWIVTIYGFVMILWWSSSHKTLGTLVTSRVCLFLGTSQCFSFWYSTMARKMPPFGGDEFQARKFSMARYRTPSQRPRSMTPEGVYPLLSL